MPTYRITVKVSKLTRYQRVEKGNYVDVITGSMSNPVISDKTKVAEAFYRKYGVDIQAIGALNTAFLETRRIERI